MNQEMSTNNQITSNDLFIIIGKQTVQIEVLQAQYQTLLAEVQASKTAKTSE